MPRLLPLIALCTVLGYTAAWLVPCPAGSPRASGSRTHPVHASAPPAHASHAHASAGTAHAHAHASAGSAHVAASRERGAPVLTVLCPCGCDDAPRVPAAGGRLPIGIASAAPALPSTPGHPAWPDASAPRPGESRASIDHVPIPS